ncbi:MAG: hypothetical protein Q8N53_10110, partial [Longimicrobiales bacterium]|nr:hypothetical protein [Longimicrobiales bacterium]
MNTMFSLRKAGRTVLLGALVAGVAACSSLEGVLDVENPTQLDEALLQDSTLVKVLVAGVVGDFANMYADPFIWRGSMMTDDQVSGINWEGTARLSQRLVRYDEGDSDLMFRMISRARMQGDSISGRLKGGLSKSPTNDLNLATTLTYAGYTYIVMADAMCEATVNVGAKIYQPLELYQIAVDRFNEALPIATAANNASLINMINVGLSRAYLNLGKKPEAMAAALKVPANYYRWVEYKGSDTRTYNPLEGNTVGANHNMGIHPNFIAGGPANFGKLGLTAFLTDPRVQHDPSWSLGHNVATPLYKPRQGLMWSEYNGQALATGGAPKAYSRDADLAIASYLEAMHNYYEAAGATGTGPLGTTLEFVNARRAVGKQAPVTLAGAELVTELRWQRGKDLFMAGFRLGDLRRWLRQGTDLFPKGVHANAIWTYGDATC